MHSKQEASLSEHTPETSWVGVAEEREWWVRLGVSRPHYSTSQNIRVFTADRTAHVRPICRNCFPGLSIDVGLCQRWSLKRHSGPLRNLLLLASFPNRMVRRIRAGCVLDTCPSQPNRCWRMVAYRLGRDVQESATMLVLLSSQLMQRTLRDLVCWNAIIKLRRISDNYSLKHDNLFIT